jgi:5-methylcytosine-specific restriction endonuclease McrA
MRYRSSKKEAEYKLRRPLVARLLEERPLCEACPIFAAHDERGAYGRRQSVDIHELKRRSQGGSILDENNLMAVCRPCHTRIGNYPQLAFDLGLSRHGYE